MSAGSATARARAEATAASMAFPPDSRMATPAAVAAGDPVTTIPWMDVAESVGGVSGEVGDVGASGIGEHPIRMTARVRL